MRALVALLLFLVAIPALVAAVLRRKLSFGARCA
jgi:hypothetical protein